MSFLSNPRLAAGLGGALATVLAASEAPAQNLGPYRQFLSIEPYYVNVQLDDAGSGVGRTSLSGAGARLWINYAPFVRSRTLAKGGIALFAHRTGKRDGGSVFHYGAEQDVFLTNRPFGGWFDPVITVGAGGYRYSQEARTVGTVRIPAASTTKFALSPGVGVRVPIPNRLQLRFDARDALIFGQQTVNGKKTLGNLEFTGALGITF